jgi:hypothetical protein
MSYPLTWQNSNVYFSRAVTTSIKVEGAHGKGAIDDKSRWAYPSTVIVDIPCYNEDARQGLADLIVNGAQMSPKACVHADSVFGASAHFTVNELVEVIEEDVRR